MAVYMVVATFRPGTDMAEVHAVADAEGAQVKVLTAEGRMGQIHLAIPQGKVFIEVFADDDAAAEATIMTLPISKWWDLEIYPTVVPPRAGD
ncbi:MAG: hypothetical protein WCP26_16440 [Actinomycetes bacterium]